MQPETSFARRTEMKNDQFAWVAKFIVEGDAYRDQ